jgi:replicative superfamily II helicase
MYVDTRELQLNSAFETQILVTTPEVLFDLYMNPALSKTWLPRIQYVIFDEIHCLCDYHWTRPDSHYISISQRFQSVGVQFGPN